MRGFVQRTYDGIMSKHAQANIERHLASGKPITVKICTALFGSTELRTAIARIRKYVVVESKWVSHGVDERHKVYWMPVRKVHDRKARA